jgi:NAD+ synthase
MTNSEGNLKLSEPTGTLNRDVLILDPAHEVDRIVQFLQENVLHRLHRQGGVVGISGGIDSSLVLALCARAFGPERVVGVLLPEGESSPESASLAHSLADHFGVRTVTEDISAALAGMGSYQRRDEAIRRIFPDYQAGWKAKITLPGNLLEKASLNVYRLTVTDFQGQEYSKRLPLQEYFQIVAASNFKQRTRMSMLYYHAELNNYSVVGTANKNEHGLGFFVKYGDGGMDVNPIGHLFKTQVYQLARFLDIPEEIQKRTPTTDTYPGGSTQEEFFYRIPFDLLDTIWFGAERGISSDEIAAGIGLSKEQVDHVIADVEQKIKTTAYLRMPVIIMEVEK